MNSPLRNNLESKTYNICRCCLKNGRFKDISLEYYCSGKKEVYEDMLRDTFNVVLTRYSGTKYLICDECIIKLREANIFKQTVLSSERTFEEYITTSQTVDESNLANDLKIELIKVEALPLEYEAKSDSFDENDTCYDDDEILSNIKMELRKENATSDSIEETKFKLKDKRTKLKRSRIKDIEKVSEKKMPSKSSDHRGNGPILRENSLKLIEHSTICVFQYNKSRYRCFCCKEPFSDMKLLKEHTQTHTLKNIEKIIILQQNRLVKVEISTLCCKLCDLNVDDLNKLKEHLVLEHKIHFSSNEDLLVPFKIETDLKCQLCNEKFTVFRLLNIHMNKHYQKQVCHVCGAGFSNLVFLNLHKTRSHKILNCKECDLRFTSKNEKRRHDMTIHGMKLVRKLRFPCPYCEMRFPQENLRVQHLVDKHGFVKPEHKCTVCEKVFITKSLKNNHVKNVHMKEKRHECDICHHRFYTKSDVLRHQVTHTGERKYSCSLCDGPFASKDSLRRHMKRTHVGTN